MQTINQSTTAFIFKSNFDLLRIRTKVLDKLSEYIYDHKLDLEFFNETIKELIKEFSNISEEILNVSKEKSDNSEFSSISDLNECIEFLKDILSLICSQSKPFRFCDLYNSLKCIINKVNNITFLTSFSKQLINQCFNSYHKAMIMNPPTYTGKSKITIILKRHFDTLKIRSQVYHNLINYIDKNEFHLTIFRSIIDKIISELYAHSSVSDYSKYKELLTCISNAITDDDVLNYPELEKSIKDSIIKVEDSEVLITFINELCPSTKPKFCSRGSLKPLSCCDFRDNSFKGKRNPNLKKFF